MLENVLGEALDDISDSESLQIEVVRLDAERRRQQAEFIARLIDTNWEDYSSVLNPGNELSDHERMRQVYAWVHKKISTLAEDYRRRIGIRVAQFCPNLTPNNPEVRLGWIKYIPLINPGADHREDQPIGHTPTLTEAGKRLVVAYLETSGYRKK
jgi:hypothetical protein